MSMMGELNFFLGLQIKQMEDGIFFNQSKYIKEMLKKFGLEDSKQTKTPMLTEIKLTKDDKADFVDRTKYLVYIMEFYKTLRLDRYEENCIFITFDINEHEFNISLDQFAKLTSLQNQGICVYTDSWSLDALKNNLEPNPPYNSNLPPLDDIRAMTHFRVIFKKGTKEGIVQKLPNQIKTNELLDHLKPCELVIIENAYVAIGNRDHIQSSIALMLYCLEVGTPFNLAYFIIRRINYFRERVDKVVPYGMILTHFFKNLKATMADHPFDDHYILVPRHISSYKAKQPRKPPLKKQRNVGKSKRAKFPSISSSKSAPWTMETCLAPNFHLGPTI
ncbi:hypothetical protein Tco_1114110 [Tanacetum coccineum]|uniref:Reverse transcriptase Ty1/copia-type domain-containing protein n=1 Tax=Tanacetum coccineum TaxID=301880 RepID=A0ABQ5IU73_9ASTR